MSHQQIEIADVPAYLRLGALYKEFLKNEGDTVVSVPYGVLKPNVLVESEMDLQWIIKSCSYWMVDDLPVSIFNFMLTNNVVTVDFNDFAYQFPVLMNVQNLRNVPNEEKLNVMYGLANPELLTMIHHLGAPIGIDAMEAAAASGSPSSIGWLLQHGVQWNSHALQRILTAGDIHCLQFALANHVPLYPNGATAVLCTSIPCLRTFAAAGGVFTPATADNAAELGLIEVLQHLHELRAPMHAEACTNAALAGHIACLRFLHAVNVPWDEDTTCAAAAGGNLDCLQYAHQQGCRWNEHCPRDAATNGHRDCLLYALNAGCAVTASATIGAARFGNLQCLTVLLNVNVGIDERAAVAAAHSGHVDCLQALLESGCPVYTVAVCNAAAARGHLECLLLAREFRCPWDVSTCAAAARGHLLTLMWAHENGCPWDMTTIHAASLQPQWRDCLQYAEINGCT